MGHELEDAGLSGLLGSGGRQRGSTPARLLLQAAVFFLLVPSSTSAQNRDPFRVAAERGTVRVLVRVRQGRFVPEGILSGASAVSGQREAIRKTRERIVERAEGYGATRIKRFRTVPFVSMELDSAGVSDLLSNPDVVSVEVDTPVRLLERAPDRIALHDSTVAIGADRAWSAGYAGAGQAVAVLDTGVETTHGFLTGKLVAEACYSTTWSGASSSSLCPAGAQSATSAGSGLNCDPSIPECDHGTHVAGIAVGNGSTSSGVGKDASLISIQVFSRFDDPDFCGSSTPCLASWTSDQILALERVLELSATIDVASVNMSLGGGRYTSAAACDAANPAMKAAIDNLRSVGIATVIAAGNEGFSDALCAPGCISSAISVGSASTFDRISSFSNEAPFLTLYAPGESIRSSVLMNGFGRKSGTSMATPHVAGAWAVLKQRSPAGSVGMLLNVLEVEGISITSSTGAWTTPRLDLGFLVESTPGTDVSVEQPVSGSVVSWPFVVSGWAIDGAASSGAGVDAVHVWAFPSGSGNDFDVATFLGAATLGISRPDLAAIYGSRFELSGFRLESTKLLEPGSYTFKAFAHSMVTGTFNQRVEVPVQVRATTRMAIGSPANGVAVGSPFTVSGWAFNTGVPGETGVDAIHVWAFPSSGAGVFLGAATLGISRPDVAAFFGVPELNVSGFRLEVASPLAVGAYTVRVFARNTVTGTFDTYQDRTLTVNTTPAMAIGKPASGATVAVPFHVSGWAVDRAASAGTGVDSVHVWAFPTNGSPGTFLGAATLGGSRPDVASLLGDPALEPSGFSLEVSTPLPPGVYSLTVFARSTVTGAFNNSRTRVIEIP